MQEPETTSDLGISDRLRRTRGRPGRRTVASTKVTLREHEELETAAKREGKVLSEWAREALLEHARKGRSDAVFTELMALRLLMNGVLRELAVGRTMTPEQHQALVTEVRRTKHEVASSVLKQYQPEVAKEE